MTRPTDLVQAIAVMDAACTFWSIKTKPRGRRRAYEVYLRGSGREARAERATKIDAINAAMETLRTKTTPKLRLRR